MPWPTSAPTKYSVIHCPRENTCSPKTPITAQSTNVASTTTAERSVWTSTGLSNLHTWPDRSAVGSRRSACTTAGPHRRVTVVAAVSVRVTTVRIGNRIGTVAREAAGHSAVRPSTAVHEQST